MALTVAELAAQKRYRDAHPDRKRASNVAAKTKRRANPDKIATDRIRTSEWYHTGGGKEWMRRYKIKTQYGLEYSEYEKLLIAQAGRCAVCGTPCAFDKDLVVDHCHNTKVVRGLLCVTCNVGIGMLKEDIAIFSAAITYLGGQ